MVGEWTVSSGRDGRPLGCAGPGTADAQCLQFGLGLWPSKADGSPIWRVLALKSHWEEAGSAVCFSLQEAGFLCH